MSEPADPSAALSAGQAPAAAPAEREAPAQAEKQAPAQAEQQAPRGGGFQVHLEVFEGPFDLLLALIAKHKLDITEVALHKVTDEFIAHIRARGAEWDLDQASHFLLVAATLLDLKAARLLPAGEVDDEEDLALLEARDLLFARLLQYRAYKEVARVFAGRMAEQSRRFPRLVPMEPRFADLLPEVLLGLGPTEFARLAAATLAPKPEPTVSMAHVYTPLASVREQGALVVARLREMRRATFRELTADCGATYEVVARFLAVLELYRSAAVAFEQHEPLGDLHVTWTGSDEGEIKVGDEYGAADPAAPAEPEQTDRAGQAEQADRVGQVEQVGEADRADRAGQAGKAGGQGQAGEAGPESGTGPDERQPEQPATRDGTGDEGGDGDE